MRIQPLVVLAEQTRGRIGILIGLSTAAVYGLTQFLEKKVVTETAPPLIATAFALMFGLIFLSILFHRGVVGDIGRAPKRAWLFVGLAGLASSWAVLTLLFALSKSPVVLVSPAVSISPLVTILLTHLFLQRLERVTRWIVIGGALIIVGATTITVSAVL